MLKTIVKSKCIIPNKTEATNTVNAPDIQEIGNKSLQELRSLSI